MVTFNLLRTNIPVNVVVVEVKSHNEVDQRLLHARGCSGILTAFARTATKDTD